MKKPPRRKPMQSYRVAISLLVPCEERSASAARLQVRLRARRALPGAHIDAVEVVACPHAYHRPELFCPTCKEQA